MSSSIRSFYIESLSKYTRLDLLSVFVSLFIQFYNSYVSGLMWRSDVIVTIEEKSPYLTFLPGPCKHKKCQIGKTFFHSTCALCVSKFAKLKTRNTKGVFAARTLLKKASWKYVKAYHLIFVEWGLWILQPNTLSFNDSAKRSIKKILGYT